MNSKNNVEYIVDNQYSQADNRVTAGACHLCLSHQGTRQLSAQVSGVRVSQQGLLACLGHSVLSTRLVQTLTQGQQLPVGRLLSLPSIPNASS